MSEREIKEWADKNKEHIKKENKNVKNKGANETMKELILFELSTKLGTNFGGLLLTNSHSFCFTLNS